MHDIRERREGPWHQRYERYDNGVLVWVVRMLVFWVACFGFAMWWFE